jgi:hypothetical protein
MTKAARKAPAAAPASPEPVGKFNASLAALLVPIDSVHEDPENARAHSDRNLLAIMESLQAFGQVKPIVVREDGRIIAGNGTWTVAKALGWTHIAAVKFDGDIRQARAYGIADNRTGELAEWNVAVLQEQMGVLQEEWGAAGVEWQPTIAGFTWEELENVGKDPGADAEMARQQAAQAAEMAAAALGHLPDGKSDETRDKELAALAKISFAVIVECANETDQRAMIEEFMGRGLKCRALV